MEYCLALGARSVSICERVQYGCIIEYRGALLVPLLRHLWLSIQGGTVIGTILLLVFVKFIDGMYVSRTHNSSLIISCCCRSWSAAHATPKPTRWTWYFHEQASPLGITAAGSSPAMVLASSYGGVKVGVRSGVKIVPMRTHGQFVELSLACLALFPEPSRVPNVENHEAERSSHTHAEPCPKTGSLSWA
jgi:hypothetical protein